MSETTNKAKSLIYKHCTDTAAISTPYLSALGIKYFRFLRVYRDGRMVVLGNLANWTKHYYEQEYFQNCVFDQPVDHISNGRYLWDYLPENPGDIIKSAANEHFGFGHGMSQVSQHDNYHDLFEFAGQRNDHQMNLRYMHFADSFNHFQRTFVEKSENLIKQQLQSPMVINKADGSAFYNLDTGEIKNLDHPLSVKHDLHFSYQEQNIKLTPRELDVLALLSIGYQMKSIALRLQISMRTVETHLNNIKRRAKIQSRQHLLAFAHENKLAIYAYSLHHELCNKSG